MFMWEEAEFFSVLGIDVYAYGLFCAIGAAAMMGLIALLGKKMQLQKGAAALMGVFAMLLGAFFSKLFFSLFSFNVDAPFFGKMKPSLFTGGGYSMTGALLGGLMGAALAGKVLKDGPIRYLDVFSVSCLAFVFFARLGEMFYPEYAGFGVSRPLIYEFTTKWPVAISDGMESYLATYLLEAIAALVMAGILLFDMRKQKKAGNTFVMFLLLFGASQVIMESLRYDRHMSYSFIRMQQVIAVLFLLCGLLLAAGRAGKKKGFLWLIVGGMVIVSGIGVALEFAIDRTTINRYLLYGAYVLLLGLPMWLGVRLRKEA